MHIIPNWSSIDSISKAKIIKSSYYWFIAVPILAKIFNKINAFEGFSNLWLFPIELPFSWQLFFFSATFIAFANFAYVVCCPKFIKEYLTYQDFIDKGSSGSHLVEKYLEMVAHIYHREKDYQIILNVRHFYSSYCKETEFINQEFESDEPQIFTITSNLVIENNQMRGAWAHVRQVAQNMHKTARTICACLYAIGLILIAIVLIENIWSVFKATGIFKILSTALT